jgi:rhomboid-like protein
MSLLPRCRSLLRPASGTLKLSGTLIWQPLYGVDHVKHQSRGKHNQPRKPLLPPRQLAPAQNRLNNQRELPRISQSIDEEKPNFPVPNRRVLLLRPAIFALSLSSAIYAFLSYRQANNELKPKGWQNPLPDLKPQQRTAPNPMEILKNSADTMDPMLKFGLGLVGANTAIHLLQYVAQKPWMMLWHLPVRNVNYTLLTSAFVHQGAVHFGCNMYGVLNFILPVGYAPTFHGDTNHVLSFYLATGILTGYAQHVASVFTTREGIPQRFIRGGGASGALFAMLGVYCASYPDTQLGIIFLPKFDAQYFFPLVMLFDFVGMVRGYSFANFGHAVCLRQNTFFLLTGLGSSQWCLYGTSLHVL